MAKRFRHRRCSQAFISTPDSLLIGGRYRYLCHHTTLYILHLSTTVFATIVVEIFRERTADERRSMKGDGSPTLFNQLPSRRTVLYVVTFSRPSFRGLRTSPSCNVESCNSKDVACRKPTSLQTPQEPKSVRSNLL